MIKPEQIPDEVVKRFATWQFPKCTNNLMRAMLADALNAWPGMVRNYSWDGSHGRIIIPLTEKTDDNV
tara:strand:+ start:509 stop:712 length:204 start_codon:yes stop_codon:yes gene_type:complete